MQNVKFVIAKSFERIHRSNLVLMGVIPLEFVKGQDADSLGLTGKEEFSLDITGAAPRSTVTIKVTGGAISEFQAVLRFDTETELTYFRVRQQLPFHFTAVVHHHQRTSVFLSLLYFHANGSHARAKSNIPPSVASEILYSRLVMKGGIHLLTPVLSFIT